MWKNYPSTKLCVLFLWSETWVTIWFYGWQYNIVNENCVIMMLVLKMGTRYDLPELECYLYSWIEQKMMGSFYIFIPVLIGW